MQRFEVLLEKVFLADQKDRVVKREGEELIKVNLMTSAVASFYEKIRTIVDYKEEHLLRKSAIFRILKRRFLESDDYYKIAENLMKELISARYLPNKKIPETMLNGHKTKRLCNNINVGFKYIEGEALSLFLDSKEIAVSTGSACSSKSLEPSHVLLALGLKPEEAHGSLRLTISKYTTKEEIDYALKYIETSVSALRKISPLWGEK